MAAIGDIKRFDREQRRIIQTIIRGARRHPKVGAYSPRERRKAINTGIAVGYTESRYRNLPGGDRDSQGWRQERAMYYKNPRNLRQSVQRFYDEYDADAPKNAPLGARAQAVQQSGTPNVWDNLADDANRVRKRFSGTVGGGNRRVYTTKHTTGGGTKTDETAAIVDSLLAGSAGKREGSLLTDITERLSSGAYTTQVPKKTTVTKRYGAPSTSRSNSQLRPGGGYMGTEAITKSAMRGFATSGKRTPEENAAAGGAEGSDHLTTKRNAYAIDGKPGDEVARTIARRLGIANKWRPGSYDRHIIKIGKNRYSVQLLWKVRGHYDHTHLGVQRIS